MEDSSKEDCQLPLQELNSRWQEATVSPQNARRSFLTMLINKLENSLVCTWLRLLVPFFGLVATLIVLCKTERHDSDRSLNGWLWLIVLNDLIAVVLKSLALKNFLDLNRVRRSSTLPDLLRMDGTYQLRNIMGAPLNPEHVATSSYEKKAKRKRLLTLLWWLKQVFYLTLIIYGSHLYGNIPKGNDSARTILALVHVIIGYVYIGVPILIIIFTFIWFTGKSLNIQKLFKKKNKTYKVDIDQLKSEKYSGTIEGYHECSICGQDYTKGQTLIRLDCDVTHHFHKNCLQAELKKRPSCPLCGVDLESDYDISLRAVHSPKDLSFSVDRVL